MVIPAGQLGLPFMGYITTGDNIYQLLYSVFQLKNTKPLELNSEDFTPA
jgi:hypothetical protein